MTKKMKPIISQNIIALRRARGWNNAHILAEKADIPYATLRDIEAGTSQGQPKTKAKIAKALGVTESDLYKDPSTKNDTKVVANSKADLLTALYKVAPALNERQLGKIVSMADAFFAATGEDEILVDSRPASTVKAR